jgi:hypothetical protein
MVPVLDDGNVIGVVTEGNMTNRLLSGRRVRVCSCMSEQRRRWAAPGDFFIPPSQLCRSHRDSVNLAQIASRS